MSTLKYFNQIEAYVEGQLSAQEREQFEQKMSKNDELSQEYQAYLATHKVLELLAFDELKRALPPPTNASKRKIASLLSHRWAIAASILMLLIAGVFWYAQTRFSNKNLVAHYYQLPTFETVRSEGSTGKLQAAGAAFYAENWERSLEILTTYTPDMPGFNYAQFILGHTYLKMDNATEAVIVFEEVVDTQTGDWQANARWHLALAYVQAGKEVEAKILLNKIITDSPDSYGQLAKELLEDLESFWHK